MNWPAAEGGGEEVWLAGGEMSDILKHAYFESFSHNYYCVKIL